MNVVRETYRKSKVKARLWKGTTGYEFVVTVIRLPIISRYWLRQFFPLDCHYQLQNIITELGDGNRDVECLHCCVSSRDASLCRKEGANNTSALSFKTTVDLLHVTVPAFPSILTPTLSYLSPTHQTSWQISSASHTTFRSQSSFSFSSACRTVFAHHHGRSGGRRS